MQSEQQFEQLILQYNQLKNGAEEIKKMIDNESFDSAMSMIKSREQLFLSCKSIRKYLELTSEQKRILDDLLDELRTLELENMRLLSQKMAEVQDELRVVQKSEKLHKAYDFDVDDKGSLINYAE